MLNKDLLNRIGMDKNLTTINEIAEHLKKLLKTESKQDICKKAKVDKSALWRLEHGENINLSNYLKIKNAYPSAFNSKPSPEISKIPLLGQIANDGKARPLTVSQESTFVAPTDLVTHWSPVFGYRIASGSAFESCVYLFSSKYINDVVLSHEAVLRIVIVFVEGKSPLFGRLRDNNTHYELCHVYTKEVLKTFKCNEKVKWARFIGQLPLSLMEYTKASPELDKDNAKDNPNVHNFKKDFQ